MSIPGLNAGAPSEMDQEEAHIFLSEPMRKRIREAVRDVIDDEFMRLEDYAAEHLAYCATDRAETFLNRVLDGDEEAAAALVGDKYGQDRYKQLGRDAGEPWAHLIHGKLFTTSGVTLRQRIVEAHTDLIRNERIADLESIVDGLERQIREQDKEINRLRDEVCR